MFYAPFFMKAMISIVIEKSMHSVSNWMYRDSVEHHKNRKMPYQYENILGIYKYVM